MDAVVQLELTRREACVLFEDSAKPRVADIQLRRLQPSFERRRLHDNELFHLPSLLAQFEEEFNTQKQLR